jgi:hypothetical protein
MAARHPLIYASGQGIPPPKSPSGSHHARPWRRRGPPEAGLMVSPEGQREANPRLSWSAASSKAPLM